jgi:hypothetical protein
VAFLFIKHPMTQLAFGALYPLGFAPIDYWWASFCSLLGLFYALLMSESLFLHPSKYTKNSIQSSHSFSLLTFLGIKNTEKSPLNQMVLMAFWWGCGA